MDEPLLHVWLNMEIDKKLIHIFYFKTSQSYKKELRLPYVLRGKYPNLRLFFVFIFDEPIFGKLSCGNCGKNVKWLIINIILVFLLTHYI